MGCRRGWYTQKACGVRAVHLDEGKEVEEQGKVLSSGIPNAWTDARERLLQPSATIRLLPGVFPLSSLLFIGHRLREVDGQLVVNAHFSKSLSRLRCCLYLSQLWHAPPARQTTACWLCWNALVYRLANPSACAKILCATIYPLDFLPSPGDFWRSLQARFSRSAENQTT